MTKKKPYTEIKSVNILEEIDRISKKNPGKPVTIIDSTMISAGELLKLIKKQKKKNEKIKEVKE